MPSYFRTPKSDRLNTKASRIMKKHDALPERLRLIMCDVPPWYESAISALRSRNVPLDTIRTTVDKMSKKVVKIKN